MPLLIDYGKKFDSFRNKTLFELLEKGEEDFIRSLAFEWHLTFQEFRQVVEAARDLSLWGEPPLREWYQNLSPSPSSKKNLLKEFHRFMSALRNSPGPYPKEGLSLPPGRRMPVVTRSSSKKIYGRCPVASEKTVCCGLQTIDVAENCSLGCRYCAIQTFYQKEAVFDADFESKLNAIPIDPDRSYHFGTGQSSDSLVWGNKNGILDTLCRWASRHSNLLLEFKTKTDNIRYFLTHSIPENVVCSWSLNTDTIITNEEHFTAPLERRLKAARQVADREIKIAFHFHPLVYYEGWEKEYGAVVESLMKRFTPSEVLFVSFGSVTLIRPVIREIRRRGPMTRIHKMELVPDPHGKLTYPDEIKVRMFKHLFDAFRPWQEKVFFYLCMEKASVWKEVFGRFPASRESLVVLPLGSC